MNKLRRHGWMHRKGHLKTVFVGKVSVSIAPDQIPEQSVNQVSQPIKEIVDAVRKRIVKDFNWHCRYFPDINVRKWRRHG